jgi:EmrB/QacA subfamily drug resistance transporter
VRTTAADNHIPGDHVPPTDLPAPTDDEPDPRRWIVFAVVGVAFLMIALDQTSVATALSTLQEDLGADLAWTGWTITIYSVGQILALPLAGRLSDQFGARRLFLGAIGVFTAISLLCGLSANLGQLIVCRFLEGLAGGALLPSATAIVATQFGRDRDRAIALFSSVFPIGAILGPLLGGVLLTVFSWRAIFLVNLPVGIALLALGSLLIRELPRSRPGPVDVGGITLMLVLLISGMVAITGIGSVTSGWAGLLAVAVPAVVSAGAAALFLRHITRHPHPVVSLQLLAGRHLGAINLANVLFGAAAIGFSALVPHYAQVRYGIVPIAAGALLTARAIGMISTSWVAVALLRRLGHRPLLIVGMGTVAAGLVLTALPPVNMSAEAWLVISAAVMGLGMGVAAPATNNAGMHLVPDQASAAAGLRTMFRQTGAILAVSVTTAVTSASADPGTANAVAFAALAGVTVVALVIAARVPNHRGRW